MFDVTALALRHGLAGAALALCLATVPVELHAQADFGDDASRWANDGECDDPRFEGAGAADTLLDEDLGHDAADCRKLLDAGRIKLRTKGAIDFGDDKSEWARDGECDDPRFEGEGAAETPAATDAFHDATDCRELLDAGRIAFSDTGRDGDGDGEEHGRIHRGRLEKGDDTLSSGEYADAYSFSGDAGQRAAVDLRSDDFDTCLFVRAPSGEQFDNDDFEDDASRSLLALDLTESGEYRVTVTSYEKSETGGYTLSIDVGSDAGLTVVDRGGVGAYDVLFER